MKNINQKLSMDYVDAIMIVDHYGKIVYSVRYNPRFDKDSCENDFGDIINKKFLEVYPMDPDESTIVNCIKTGKSTYLGEQAVKDYKGRVINTTNLTIPIIRSGKILGAIELSKDITKIKEKIETKNKSIREIKKDEIIMYNFEDIITENEDMINNIEKAKIVANKDSSILVYGETGTGKELYVQSIHNYSNRKDKPFIAQNCAALPENLFESILFGSVKGSFTGAMDKAGLFEQADAGTLFLDEINSMPLNLQAKLLRVLQDNKVRRVGDNKDKKVNVRIIAAMNIDPMESLEKGHIREDLFYRLNVISIKLLPLRERREDILIYVNHFIKKYNKDLTKDIAVISDEVKNLFLNYEWPGNVRELEHVIESSMSFTKDKTIELFNLPVYLSDKVQYTRCDPVDIDRNLSLDDTLEKIEKDMILNALKKTRGNISKAAKILKITRQRLHYKIDKYGFEKSE